jgi:DNA-binding MarR family transcriptional regulator
MTIAQLSALATVVHAGPLGVGQLAEAEILPSPAATRLADRLEEAGLISRQMNPMDRRGVLLAATPKGADLVAQRERAGNAWLAQRLSAMSEADRVAMQTAVRLLEALLFGKDGAAPGEGKLPPDEDGVRRDEDRSAKGEGRAAPEEARAQREDRAPLDEDGSPSAMDEGEDAARALRTDSTWQRTRR